MSSHGHQGGGGQGQEEKSSMPRLPGQQQLTQQQQQILTSAVQRGGDIMSKSFQAVRTTVATQRPIAPAPGPSITQPHLATQVGMTSTQLVGAQQSLVKVNTAQLSSLGNVVEAANLAGQGSAVNISTVHPQPHPSGTASATLGQQPTAGVPQTVSIPAGTPVSLQSSGTNIVQVPMASLIRAPQQLQALQQPGQQGAAPVVHAFQSHVPRGAAMAASALAAPKSSGVATAVLRPSQPAAAGLAVSTGASLPTANPAQILGSQIQLQPRALLPVRPPTSTTPPITAARTGSPSVTSATSIAHSDPHRPVLTHHSMATTSATTVQITIQQPKTMTEITPRTMLSHLPTAKQGQLPQAILQSQLPVQTQKVVMSQATVSPIIQPSSTAAGGTKVGQNPTYYHSIPRSQKIVVTQSNVTGHQTSALASSGVTTTKTVGGKTQKIMMAQPGGAAMQPNSSVTLSQHTGVGKAQKIMMTPPTVPIQPHSTVPLVTHAGIKAQKIVMSQSGVPNLQPTTVTLTPQGHKVIGQGFVSQKSVPVMNQDGAKTNIATNPSINLSQSLSRPNMQKVVMTQVTVAGASQVAPTISSVPKSVAAVGPTVPIVHPVSSVSSATNVVATTVTSIPVAKVPPQRQLPHSPQTSEFGRETAAQVVYTQSSSLYTAQHQATAAATTANATSTTVATTQGDGRQQDRPGYPISYPFPEYVYYSSTINPYHQNLMLQQHGMAAAHTAQGFTSIPGSAPIRPGIVPSQNPNLAATLQPSQGVTVSSAQPVRINPMMVTVDPNRHPALSVHNQYPQGSEGSGTSNEANINPIPTTAVHGTVTTQVAMPSQVQPPPSPMANSANNPTASPRPSILRKRTNEGISVAKKNLLSSLDSTPTPPLPTPSPQPISIDTSPKPSIPCDPSRENSQSSTDTATSTESTPQSSQTPELKLKQEPLDSLENVLLKCGAVAGPLSGVTVGHGSTPTLPNSVEASPRKKPRKQLLNANEELKDGTSSEEEEEKYSSKMDLKSHLERMACLHPEDAEYVDDEGIRWVAEKKRPNILLLNHYSCNWKSRNNHFQRHADVKPKEERRPTVNELSNVKGVVQKASGWKLYHLASQLEEMMDLERDMFSKMGNVQELIAPKHIAKHTMEDDISKVHELTQGNIQRCQLVIDQLDEARSSMLKILEHKQRIMEIVSKHRSKRPVKKKERS